MQLTTSYFCPLPPPPVFVSAVPAADPAWLLVDPGTIVVPVAPGVLLFVAAPVGLTGWADPELPVFMPEAALLSAVPGDAVVELLLPMLPAGLFDCAIAELAANAIKLAASSIGLDLETIACSSQRRRGGVP
jgi:hypothetical protein